MDDGATLLFVLFLKRPLRLHPGNFVPTMTVHACKRVQGNMSGIHSNPLTSILKQKY